MKLKTAALGLLALLLAGCGGGSAKTSALSPSGGAQDRGSLAIGISWPQRSTGKLIPAASQSILVTVTQNGNRANTATIPRPPSGVNSTNTTITNVPTGTVTVTATAFPNADASGVAQSTGTTAVSVLKSQPTAVNLTLGSTITAIRLSQRARAVAAHAAAGARSVATTRDDPPVVFSLTPGQKQDLIATAVDDAGEVVLTDPTKWTWKSGNDAVATIAPTGDSASLSAAGLGSTTLTATETESGKLTQATVMVGGGAGWTQYGGDAQKSFRGLGPSGPGDFKFRIAPTGITGLAVNQFGDNSNMLLSQDGSFVFRANMGMTVGVYALLSDGTVKWSHTGFEFAETIEGIGPDGTVYTLEEQSTSTDFHLIALDGASGDVRWSVPSHFGVSHATISPAGALFFKDDTDVLSIDPATGAEIWRTTVSAPSGALFSSVVTEPALGLDGTIYVGTFSNGVVALNPQTGAILWKSGGSAGYVAVAPGGTVYAITGGGSVSSGGSLTALDPATGTVRWQQANSQNVAYNGPLVVLADGAVCANGIGDQGSTCHDGATGAVRWSVANTLLSSAASDGTAYLFVPVNPSFNGIEAVDGMTGAVKWNRLPTADSATTVYSSIVGPDGTLYTSEARVLTPNLINDIIAIH